MAHTTPKTAAPTCPFQNPQTLFPDLKQERSKDRIEFNPTLNAYIISRYDDILPILDDPLTFSSAGITVPDFPDVIKPLFTGRVPPGGTLLGHDNPDHDRLRSAVNGFFMPRKLTRFKPLMTHLAHELIDTFVSKGQIELKAHFALPLPLKTVIAVAGLDVERWEWIGRCLALFGGISEGSLSIEQQVQDVLDLHDYVAKIIQERKCDRRDDLISHIWEMRDSGVVQMSDFEHLGMIPGLLLAGHETTTSLLSIGVSHLLHRGLWEEANRDEEARGGAIEELLRFESAITGMYRLVNKETRVGETTLLRPGDRVFLAYNSGSRDERVFQCPGQLQLGRKSARQHLGFGRGIHACLGAPLARLLLRTEFEVLRERLPGLRLVTPYEEIRYEKVGASRGIEGVVVAWDVVPESQSPRKSLSTLNKGVKNSNGTQTIPATVENLLLLTEEVLEVTLTAKSPAQLPPWEPGAHIDILTPHGYRQYSLCSNHLDPSEWKIAIRKEATGSGGSLWLHENLRPGDNITVRGPRNHFRLQTSPSARYIFIAGGIGITPMKAMAAEAKLLGVEYRLIYLGRSSASMAYLDDLRREHPLNALATMLSDRGERFDVQEFIKGQDKPVQVYCCGPERLLDALEGVCRENPMVNLRVERFQVSTARAILPNRGFEVVLRRSGRKLSVAAEETLLEVLNRNGCGIMSTCSKGTCGTCEVPVVEGQPDHRDSVLSQEEKDGNAVMMPCVSRCVGDGLALDLW